MNDIQVQLDLQDLQKQFVAGSESHDFIEGFRHYIGGLVYERDQLREKLHNLKRMAEQIVREDI